MIRFKNYLLEYLTDDQRARYAHVKMTDKARSDTDHFFGKDNDIVHGTLHHLTDKSEIHKKVENHLGRELSHDEYTTGLTKDKYGRDAKIGRMIKDEKLRDEFARDPVREGSRSRQAQYTTSTVRGVEVAGQTNPMPNAEHPKGHSWKDISCKNIENGINKRYLKAEIKHGTVVHRVHDHNGQEIYRATLHPHHNKSGDVVYVVDSEYGIKHPSFTDGARNTARMLSGNNTEGIFKKSSFVYDDNAIKNSLHPMATQKQIGDALMSPKRGYQEAAITHPDIQKHHLTHALKDPNVSEFVKSIAARHSKADESHISLALSSPYPLVRWAAIEHPAATHEIIDKALDDPSMQVRSVAARHPNASHENLMKALHPDQDEHVKISALSNPNITSDHIRLAIKDTRQHIRGEAAAHPMATAAHIDLALSDQPYVKTRAMTNPNINSDHLHKALRSDTGSIAYEAISHPNINSDHLHTALEHPDPVIRRKAIIHPKATLEHWRKAKDDENTLVSNTAWDKLDRHYNADSA